jgi:hypothetical protein
MGIPSQTIPRNIWDRDIPDTLDRLEFRTTQTVRRNSVCSGIILEVNDTVSVVTHFTPPL